MVYTSNGRMNIKDIRRENARTLAREAGGVASFARAMDWSNSSRASQYIGKNPVKNIGDGIAAEIEKAFGKEAGWLDHVHSGTTEAEGLPGNEELLLDAMRAVRKEIRGLGLQMTEEDMDELVCRATINLYRYTLAAGGKELLPANIAILSLLPGK